MSRATKRGAGAAVASRHPAPSPPQASPLRPALSGLRVTVRRGETPQARPRDLHGARGRGSAPGSFPPAGGAAVGLRGLQPGPDPAAGLCGGAELRPPSASPRSAGPAARPEGHGPDQRLSPGPARRVRPQPRPRDPRVGAQRSAAALCRAGARVLLWEPSAELLWDDFVSRSEGEGNDLGKSPALASCRF